jgi:hypothetical protein
MVDRDTRGVEVKITIEISSDEFKRIRPALRKYFNEKAHTSIEELIKLAIRHIANEESENYQDWKTAAVAKLHCNIISSRRSN